mmetsp:Transcript_3802/g.7114  ORF Transcript_3802/g.7114 Transcript_3802/m.7114 type:complete len:291 (+) Transcript_3802:87-959(+)
MAPLVRSSLLLVIAVLPSSSSAWSWTEIIQSLIGDGERTEAEVSNEFRFDDALWDTSVDEVSLDEVQSVLGCPEADAYGTIEDAFGYSRIPTEENTWSIMYAAYHHVVEPSQATIPLEGHQHNAFVMPVESFYAPYVGRGIKAATFIPKGTLVWRPRNAAEFTSVQDLRHFLEHIMTHSTYEVACDAIRWLYAAKASPEEDDYVMCIDFDEGSIINRAMTDEERNVKEFIQIGPNKLVSSLDPEHRVYGCQEGSLYATRDIYPGEELKMYYTDSSEGYGFVTYGLDATGL